MAISRPSAAAHQAGRAVGEGLQRRAKCIPAAMSRAALNRLMALGRRVWPRLPHREMARAANWVL
jgi:hypothetical protein